MPNAAFEDLDVPFALHNRTTCTSTDDEQTEL